MIIDGYKLENFSIIFIDLDNYAGEKTSLRTFETFYR